MHDVSCDTDQIGIHREVDLLDVLVAERDLVLGGCETGQGRHRKIREDAAFAECGKNLIVGPERRRVLRGDKMDLHKLPWDSTPHRGPAPRGSVCKFGKSD